MTLKVNDKLVAIGKAAGLIKRQPQEDLCLGHDNAKPPADYPATKPF